MKQYIFKILAGVALLTFASCNNILDEKPRSIMTPDLFTTQSGLESGLIAAYSGLRYIGGAQASQFSTEYGTDEFTGGEGNANPALDMQTGSNPINASTGDISTYWTNLFPYINTCNGVIDYGTKSGFSEEKLAEAYLAEYRSIWVQVNWLSTPVKLTFPTEIPKKRYMLPLSLICCMQKNICPLQTLNYLQNQDMLLRQLLFTFWQRCI
jgi:hypothetical protein